MLELASLPALERAARVDLAAAFRMAVRMDLHEGVCNHFTLMLPDGKRFLLNRYGLHWSEVSASTSSRWTPTAMSSRVRVSSRRPPSTSTRASIFATRAPPASCTRTCRTQPR
jgi:ribulose-5-phosphate 4-epimerase/fuculose-1-phosphate aldolase